MNHRRKTIALVCVLALLLVLAPAAFADLDRGNPDREALDPETGGIAAIYDAADLFTEEEQDHLMVKLQGCAGWFDFYIVTDDRTMNEIAEDPLLLELCSGYHLALLFGAERADMRAQWTFPSGDGGEEDVIAPDNVAALFSSAKRAYLDGASAYEAADSFATAILGVLQEIGAEQTDLPNDRDNYYFRTLEELMEILALDPERDEVFISNLEAQDYTLEEDLTIPGGKKVFFNEGTVTVAPGVTVTVEEDAGLFFYGLDVQGTVVNNGDLVQCKMRDGSSPQLPIHVEGEIINRDWFSFYEIAEGMENIHNLDAGRLFSSVQGKRVSTDEPSSTPRPSSTPKDSGSTESGTKKNSSGRSSSAGIFILWVIIIVAAALSKNPDLRKKMTNLLDIRDKDTGKPAASARSDRGRSAAGSSVGRTGTAAGSRRDGSTARSPAAYQPETYNPAEYSYNPTDYSETDAMAHDRQRRMKQLDDWLKSGLIDRDEYRRLKDEYSKY